MLAPLQRRLARWLAPVARVLTGESTTAPYSRWLLGLMVTRGLRLPGPSELRIR